MQNRPITITVRPFLAAIVDPGLVWSTLLGGSDNDDITAMEVDPSDGEIVVVGVTKALDSSDGLVIIGETSSPFFPYYDGTTNTVHPYPYFAGGYDSAVSFTLGGGQVLLIIDGGGGEVLTQTPKAGPTAIFSLPVPDDASPCGLAVYTQALHFGGVTPFALSNAMDLVLGA